MNRPPAHAPCDMLWVDRTLEAFLFARVVLLAAVFLQQGFAQTFEVASIRASQFESADGEGGQNERIEVSGDRLTTRDMTLRSYITWAYSLQDFQVAGDAGADRFDIDAKTTGPLTTPMARAMLATLLRDRFALAFHRQAKRMAALDLVVAKGGPKLRVSSEDAPGVFRPGKSRIVAQHAAMSEFVGTLSGPLRTPVLDKTGLTGRYDFTVDLSSYFADMKAGEQPDITSIVTSALREQAGLSLEMRKEPVEILVIDHVERKPTEN